MKFVESLELCLDHITGQFETGGDWSRVTDNFDGFGPSVGIIQFAWGMGSLQPLLKRVEEEDGLACYFGDEKGATIRGLLQNTVKDQREYANANFFDGKKWKDKAIEEGFEKMAASATFRKAQIEGARGFGNMGVELFKADKFKTVRAFAIMFDVAVQNGGVARVTRAEIAEAIKKQETETGRALSEKERLKTWIEIRVSKSNPLWQKDVMTRKLSILNDGGRVHGKDFNFSSLNLDAPFELV